jgi:tetratricopeptide (TPR) repeat protein
MKYLAENTEYINKKRSERTWNLIQTLKGTDDLNDCYLAASIYIGSARYEEALAYIRKSLKLCDPTERPEFYTELLTKKGCLLTLMGENDEALKTLDLVTDRDPQAADVYLVKAQIYFEQNNLEKLAETSAQYLEVVPDDVSVRITYLQTLAALDVVDEAKKQGRIIIEDASADTEAKDDAYHILAMLALREENFKEALRNLQQVKDTKEKYPDVNYDIGVCQMSKGEFDEAIEYFTRSIEQDYNKQGCYYSRGVCEFSNDPVDYESAYFDLLAAVEYDEEDRDEETAALAESILEQAYKVIEE